MTLSCLERREEAIRCIGSCHTHGRPDGDWLQNRITGIRIDTDFLLQRDQIAVRIQRQRLIRGEKLPIRLEVIGFQIRRAIRQIELPCGHNSCGRRVNDIMAIGAGVRDGLPILIKNLHTHIIELRTNDGPERVNVFFVVNDDPAVG